MFRRKKTRGASFLPTVPVLNPAYAKPVKHSKIRVYKDKHGLHRWRLVSTNGKILADSGQGYARKRNCLEAVPVFVEQAQAASLEVI